VGFGLGWYDPWYYGAGYYSPAYYDYGYYGDPYYGYDPYAYDPYAYDPYGYYGTPAPVAAGVVMDSPVWRVYAPARVLVVGDGRWHRFGER